MPCLVQVVVARPEEEFRYASRTAVIDLLPASWKYRTSPHSRRGPAARGNSEVAVRRGHPKTRGSATAPFSPASPLRPVRRRCGAPRGSPATLHVHHDTCAAFRDERSDSACQSCWVARVVVPGLPHFAQSRQHWAGTLFRPDSCQPIRSAWVLMHRDRCANTGAFNSILQAAE